MRVRHRLALVAAGAGLLVASAAVMATRRSAVEQRLGALLADTLAAPCTFESAEFGVLDGLRVYGLRVLDPDAPFGPPLVSVAEARIDYHIGLLGSGPRITQVILQGPHVRLALGPDGTPALARLAARVPTREGTPGSTALPTIRIFGGTLEIAGAPLLAPTSSLVLRGISADIVADGSTLRVPRATATSELWESATLTATSRGGGHDIVLSARLTGVDVARLRTAGVPSAVAAVLDDHDVSGRVDVEGTLTITDGRIVDVAGRANVSAADFLFTIPEHPDLTPPAPIRVRVDGAELALAEGTVTLINLAAEALGAPVTATGEIHLAGVPGAPGGREPSIHVDTLVQGVRVGPHVVPQLHEDLRRVQRAFDLSGTANIHLVVDGPLARPTADAHLDVRGARASYLGYIDPATGVRRGFPWTVQDLVGTVDVHGARVEFAARGRHGVANVAVTGHTATHANGFPETSVRIAATDVPIDDDLRAGFQGRETDPLAKWRPRGTAGALDVEVIQDPQLDRGGTATNIVVSLDGRAAFEPDHLPVPLHHASGTIRILEPWHDGRRISQVEIEGVTARGDGFVLRSVDGTVLDASARDGTSGTADETLRVVVDVDDLAGPFRRGLVGSTSVPDSVKRAVGLLDPRGPATIDVTLVSESDARDDRVTIDLRGVAIAGWEGVPLDARNVRGRIAYAADGLATDGLDLDVLGAGVRLRGELTDLSAETPRPNLEIHAMGLPLGTRLRRALGTLADGLAGAWDEIAPAPDLTANVRAHVAPPGGDAAELTFDLDDVRGGVRLVGLRLDVDGGSVHFDGRNVRGDAAARLGEGRVEAGTFRYDTGSGDAEAQLDVRGLRFAGDLVPLVSADVAQAIDGALRPSRLHVTGLHLDWDASARRLSLSGAAALRPATREHDGAHLPLEGAFHLEDVEIDLPAGGALRGRGRARLEGVRIDPGVAIEDLDGEAAFELGAGDQGPRLGVTVSGASTRLAGFPLKGLSFGLVSEGDLLRIEDIAATVHDGRLAGRFTRGGERLAYRGDVRIDGLDLAKAGREPGAERGGLVDLEVRFRNPTGDADDLEGTGSVAVAGADVRVPFLTAALEAVNGALFGAAAIEGGFQGGHADFDLRGSRVLVRELEVAGPRVPLLFDAEIDLRNGRGALDLASRRIDLVVYPRVRFAALDIDPTGIVDRVFGLAQFVFRRLRIEGTLRNPRTSWEVIAGDLEEEFRPRPLPVGEIRPYGPEPW